MIDNDTSERYSSICLYCECELSHINRGRNHLRKYCSEEHQKLYKKRSNFYFFPTNKLSNNTRKHIAVINNINEDTEFPTSELNTLTIVSIMLFN
jgi:hypothetical protein